MDVTVAEIAMSGDKMITRRSMSFDIQTTWKSMSEELRGVVLRHRFRSTDNGGVAVLLIALARSLHRILLPHPLSALPARLAQKSSVLRVALRRRVPHHGSG